MWQPSGEGAAKGGENIVTWKWEIQNKREEYDENICLVSGSITFVEALCAR